MRQPTIHQMREKKKSSRKVEEAERLQYFLQEQPLQDLKPSLMHIHLLFNYFFLI
jgi:hypothetical protein